MRIAITSAHSTFAKTRLIHVTQLKRCLFKKGTYSLPYLWYINIKCLVMNTLITSCALVAQLCPTL